jgi:hypothetical protein
MNDIEMLAYLRAKRAEATDDERIGFYDEMIGSQERVIAIHAGGEARAAALAYQAERRAASIVRERAYIAAAAAAYRAEHPSRCAAAAAAYRARCAAAAAAPAPKPKAAPKPRGKGSVTLTTHECIEYLLGTTSYDLAELKTKTLFVMWELIKMLPIDADRRHIPGTTNRGQIEEFIRCHVGHFSLFNPAAGTYCYKKAQWLVKRDTLRGYGYAFDESEWVEPKA